MKFDNAGEMRGEWRSGRTICWGFEGERQSLETCCWRLDVGDGLGSSGGSGGRGF